MRSGPLSKLLGVSSVLLLVATIASDWPTSLLSNFWAEHAMLTNIVSSLIFLLLGATLVERWLARQEEQKYRAVEASAFSAVSRAPLAVRRTLWFLVNGGLEEQGAEKSPVEPEERERLLGILKRHGFEIVKERDVGVQRHKVPCDADRLRVLLTDEEWIELAHPIIRRTHSSSRSTMAGWAQLLMTSKRSSRSLQELAAVMTDLGSLRDLTSRLYHEDRDLDADYAIRIALAWRKVFVNTCVVFEDFLLTVETPGFERWSLELVQPVDRSRMISMGIVKGKPTRSVARVYGDGEIPLLSSAVR